MANGSINTVIPKIFASRPQDNEVLPEISTRVVPPARICKLVKPM